MVPPISVSSTATGSSSTTSTEQQHQHTSVDANVTVNNKMMDATLLRNALRLVHCIQKERGASCAYFASYDAAASAASASASATALVIKSTVDGGDGKRKTKAHNKKTNSIKKRNRFETQLQQARMASNVALQLLTDHIASVERQRKKQQQQNLKKDDVAKGDDTNSNIKARSKLSSRSPTLPILNNLMKIRNLIDINTTTTTTANSSTTTTDSGTSTTATSGESSSSCKAEDHEQHHPKDELVFHRIFVCFNTLINFIAQEYIHKHTKILSTSSSSPALHAMTGMTRSSSRHRKLNSLGVVALASPKRPDAAAGRKTTSTSSINSEDDYDGVGDSNIHNKNRHRRELSMDINDKLSSAWKISPVPAELMSGVGVGPPPSGGFDRPPVKGTSSRRKMMMNRIDSVGYDDDEDDDDNDDYGNDVDRNDDTLKTSTSRKKSTSVSSDDDFMPPPPPPLLPPRILQQPHNQQLQPPQSRSIGSPSSLRHGERKYGERFGGGGGGGGDIGGTSPASWLAKVKPPSSPRVLEDVARSYDSIANEAATLIRKMSFTDFSQNQTNNNNLDQQPLTMSAEESARHQEERQQDMDGEPLTPRRSHKPTLGHSSSMPSPTSPSRSSVASNSASTSGLLSKQLQQHNNRQQRQDLLDLLNCFVQLKESTGVERAILSSLLAFEDAANVSTRVSAGEQLINDLSFGTGGDGGGPATAVVVAPGGIGKAISSIDHAVSTLSLSPQSRERLFSDLIVEVENQRRLIAKLREFPNGNSSSSSKFGRGVESGSMGLSNLVLELAELSPSLLELQTKILTNPGGFLNRSNSFESDEEQKDGNADDGFDEAVEMLSSSFLASSLRSSTSTSSASTNIYDPETIFQVITIYMDKLHSLELLIVEELEACCQPIPRTEPSAAVKSMSDSASALSVEEPQHHPIEESQSQETSLLKARPSILETTASLPSLSNALQQHVLVGFNGNHGNLQDSVDVANVEYVVRQVEAMSPQQIKTLLLDALQLEANNAQRAAPPALPSGDEVQSRPAPSLQHQYSSWAADEIDELNDKINSALASSSSHHSGSGVGDDANFKQRRQSKILNRAASKEWEIGIYEIKFQRRIGQGASGTTYRGTWSGQSVAVKVASITEFGLDGWRTEVSALQRLHHPNVIRLLGSVYHENPLTFCLVLEYCNAGGKSCRMS